MPMNGNYSIYIHVPFCLKKCGYCNFFVIPFEKKSVDLYLDALKKEIEAQMPLFPKEAPVSIYFGGGTPSLLAPEQIALILSWLPKGAIEITLEVNPEKAFHMKEFKEAGINRVSLGVQSLDDTLLTLLTRKHQGQTAIDAVYQTVEAGIKNVSIDLMYEIPNLTLQSWHNTISKAVALPITHLSLYNLTFEPNTLFFKREKELKKSLPTENESVSMLEEGVALFEKHGLKRYEISAFAKEGYESKHNLGYWTKRPFLGFGPSAFSYWEGKRFQNVCSLSQYAKREKRIAFEETLPPDEQKNELLAIGLRVLKGVNYQEPLTKTLSKLVEEGLLTYQNENLALTPRGILFYDSLASEIVGAS